MKIKDLKIGQRFIHVLSSGKKELWEITEFGIRSANCKTIVSPRFHQQETGTITEGNLNSYTFLDDDGIGIVAMGAMGNNNGNHNSNQPPNYPLPTPMFPAPIGIGASNSTTVNNLPIGSQQLYELGHNDLLIPIPAQPNIGNQHIHIWKHYTGLQETFEYCTICNAKKGTP